jgi:exonuclease SbcD
MLKILHFADAHIDIANHGRHDPVTGLPVRIQDFLKALDTIVDAAIAESVDLVLFAGDAYKDRSPAPTYQREWDRRMVRLSQAGIRTLLLVGNHDLSPAVGRAHALQELDTLAIPNITVIGKPTLLGPADLNGLPVQVIGMPWITRSSMMATLELSGANPSEVYEQLEERVTQILNQLVERLDPSLPAILMAHASVQGALYGGERSVMLGSDLVLPGSLVKNPRFDYVALGHIHKAQNLNEHNHPPVIYPGSIERVDFGEAHDQKYYVLAEIDKGSARFEWKPIPGRRFIDRFLQLLTLEELQSVQPARSSSLIDLESPVPNGLPSPEQFLRRLVAELPEPDQFEDAIVRLVVEYPRAWDPLLDEAALHEYCQSAFEFQLVRRPKLQARIRLPGEQTVSSLTPLELLNQYWDSLHAQPAEKADLARLADEIIRAASQTDQEPPAQDHE